MIANTFAGLDIPHGPRPFPQQCGNIILPKNALGYSPWTPELSSWPWHQYDDVILYQPRWEGTLRWDSLPCLRLKLRKA